ncbi:hypothetical protein ACIBG0_16465 [Nocardia sp. NPDC050630]|uniref:DUF7373 family lipoprotein n=1 Tax=Nocardia sp. NPDC050630 TaxID=3364321 RepID=UPI0037A0A26F
MNRVVPAMAVALLMLISTADCAVSGHPVPANPHPKSLDIGVNSIDPLSVPPNNNEGYGRTLESVRMAEAIIDPVEADASLKFSFETGGALPLPTPVKATRVLAKTVRPVLERYGMLAGFMVGGADKEQIGQPVTGRSRLLTVVLLRFPDANAARQAAREMDAVDAAVSPENVPVVIANQPSAFAHWRPNVPALAATMAHESFVISVLIGHTSPDLAALTGVARQAFEAQSTRLRGFSATPPDKFAELPLDSDDMLAKLIAEVPGRWPFPTVVMTDYAQNAGWSAAAMVTGIVFGPRGTYLNGSRERPSSVELDAINGWNELERYPDAIAARRAFSDADLEDDPAIRSAPAPDAVPDVRCVEQLDVPPQIPLRVICRLVHGRYNALIRGRDLKSTHQQVAAQLALLLNSE